MIIQELSEDEKVRYKAVMIIQELSEDEKVRYEADMRERAIRDYNSAMYGAHEQGVKEGIEQGIEQGEKKKALAMAKTLLENGVDINLIIESSGLSKEEIEKL